MKNIEDIKTELILKMLQDLLIWSDIENLPKHDELRTFICQFKAQCVYWYARWADKGPTDETRTAVACKDPFYAFLYALNVDKKPHMETKTAACKDPGVAYYYACWVDKAPSEETRTAVSKDPGWAEKYQEWERQYNEEH